jgi:hypothetical protein
VKVSPVKAVVIVYVAAGLLGICKVLFATRVICADAVLGANKWPARITPADANNDNFAASLLLLFNFLLLCCWFMTLLVSKGCAGAATARSRCNKAPWSN